MIRFRINVSPELEGPSALQPRSPVSRDSRNLFSFGPLSMKNRSSVSVSTFRHGRFTANHISPKAPRAKFFFNMYLIMHTNKNTNVYIRNTKNSYSTWQLIPELPFCYSGLPYNKTHPNLCKTHHSKSKSSSLLPQSVNWICGFCRWTISGACPVCQQFIEIYFCVAQLGELQDYLAW